MGFFLQRLRDSNKNIRSRMHPLESIESNLPIFYYDKSVGGGHSGCLAWKSFLSTTEEPPGPPAVSNEAVSFTKHATGGLVC